MPKYKRAQTGETITWLVATIIIIGLLVCFFYAASLLAKTKSISISSFDNKKSEAWSEKKIAFADATSAGKNKDLILNWINSGEKKNE